MNSARSVSVSQFQWEKRLCVRPGVDQVPHPALVLIGRFVEMLDHVAKSRLTVFRPRQREIERALRIPRAARIRVPHVEWRQ